MLGPYLLIFFGLGFVFTSLVKMKWPGLFVTLDSENAPFLAVIGLVMAGYGFYTWEWDGGRFVALKTVENPAAARRVLEAIPINIPYAETVTTEENEKGETVVIVDQAYKYLVTESKVWAMDWNSQAHARVNIHPSLSVVKAVP